MGLCTGVDRRASWGGCLNDNCHIIPIFRAAFVWMSEEGTSTAGSLSAGMFPDAMAPKSAGVRDMSAQSLKFAAACGIALTPGAIARCCSILTTERKTWVRGGQRHDGVGRGRR